jgi:hypothetical protein
MHTPHPTRGPPKNRGVPTRNPTLKRNPCTGKPPKLPASIHNNLSLQPSTTSPPASPNRIQLCHLSAPTPAPANTSHILSQQLHYPHANNLPLIFTTPYISYPNTSYIPHPTAHHAPILPPSPTTLSIPSYISTTHNATPTSTAKSTPTPRLPANQFTPRHSPSEHTSASPIQHNKKNKKIPTASPTPAEQI